jgi:small basic protein (TIGR04137 family)
MSIDKSLRRKNQLERARNVLTRAERIKVLQKEERWEDGRSPFGLPKVRVHRIVVKKVKKAKEEEKPAVEEGAEAVAPVPEAEKKSAEKKAPEKKGAEKKGAEKKGGDKK